MCAWSVGVRHSKKLVLERVVSHGTLQVVVSTAGGRAEPFEAFGARIVRLVEHLRAVDHRFCGAARKRLDYNLSAMLRLVALRYT